MELTNSMINQDIFWDQFDQNLRSNNGLESVAEKKIYIKKP